MPPFKEWSSWTAPKSWWARRSEIGPRELVSSNTFKVYIILYKIDIQKETIPASYA